MADIVEERQQARKETGAALMLIGLAIWVADALVLFFFRAAIRAGTAVEWLAGTAAFAVLGLVLVLKGFFMRGRPED
jgi:hypothetical protein